MLIVDEGSWWDMEGRAGAGQLRLRQEGPALAAAVPDRVVVTGWRVVGADDPPGEVWIVAQVPTHAVGRR